VNAAGMPERSSPQPKRPRELALSAAWHGGMTRSLHTIDGTPVSVIFPGNWSHGHGPDFASAMLDIPGKGLVTGDVELHYDASDWVQHGHHLDPRYTNVILHVVTKPDAAETRRADGAIVPVAVMKVPDDVLFRIDARLPDIWAELGGEVCAGHLAADQPHHLVQALRHLGDQRLTERVTHIEGELAARPERDVLTSLLLDAMGYSENREPMLNLANVLNATGWSSRLSARTATHRLPFAQALLFGIAGFLPLAPGDAHLAGLDPVQIGQIEAIWKEEHSLFSAVPAVPATAWQRARTRPANHPARRLATAAGMLAALAIDAPGDILHAMRSSTSPVTWLQDLPGTAVPALGTDRATAMIATVILPFALAIARREHDHELEEIIGGHWENLPKGSTSRPGKRALTQVAGSRPLRGLGERGNQGLLKLDRDFCTPRRCFECPIAAEVVRSELAAPPNT